MAFDFHIPVSIGDTLYSINLDTGALKNRNVSSIKIISRCNALILDESDNIICTTSEISEGSCYRGKCYITTSVIDAYNKSDSLRSKMLDMHS